VVLAKAQASHTLNYVKGSILISLLKDILGFVVYALAAKIKNISFILSRIPSIHVSSSSYGVITMSADIEIALT
jgi:hypothetical protein